jgi:hypothetical protein
MIAALVIVMCILIGAVSFLTIALSIDILHDIFKDRKK